jgi:hypothetical protein
LINPTTAPRPRSGLRDRSLQPKVLVSGSTTSLNPSSTILFLGAAHGHCEQPGILRVRQRHHQEKPMRIIFDRDPAHYPEPRTSKNRSEHGSTDRWRWGCRCLACKGAHVEHSRMSRRGSRDAEFAKHAEHVLSALASGETPESACAGTTLSAGKLYGRARWDEGWRNSLDVAMSSGRLPGVPHGTETAYKAGCRCPNCRFQRTH